MDAQTYSKFYIYGQIFQKLCGVLELNAIEELVTAKESPIFYCTQLINEAMEQQKFNPELRDWIAAKYGEIDACPPLRDEYLLKQHHFVLGFNSMNY